MRIDWLARVKTRLLRPRRSRSRHFRGEVQQLEDRALLSTFVVNSTDDNPDADLSDGIAADSQAHVTLRAAIQQANASFGADTITVPAGIYLLTLIGSPGEDQAATGDLNILDDVTITGGGSDQTIIDGLLQDRVFDVKAGVTAQISGLKITNGVVTSGQGDGGGVRNMGTLTMQNVVLDGNSTAGSGGAIASFGVNSVLTIT